METIMETVTAKTSNTTNETLLRMSVSRNERGIICYFESPIIEEWVRSQAINRDYLDSSDKRYCMNSDSQGWKDHRGYMLPDTVPQFASLRTWGSPIHNSGNNGANLAFLTTKGLSKGVTFEFEGLYSQNTIERFMRDTKNQVKSLFHDFIKAKSCTLDIYLREID